MQGVGFRYFVQEKAIALGIVGWVTNQQNGSVEATAQGPRATLEKWLGALREGPPLSRVTSVNADWQTPTEALKNFVIK